MKESRSDIFFNCFLVALQSTLGYYQGDNPHQPDVNHCCVVTILTRRSPGDLVSTLTCFKAPGVLQFKIVENAVITIGLVMLFFWKSPKVGCGPTK